MRYVAVMDAQIIAAAVPVFLLMIAIELAVARWRRQALYRFEDTHANLMCGVGQQFLLPLSKGIELVVYGFVLAHGARWPISNRSGLAWAAVFLAADFLYYVFHRASHRIAFMWAAHGVHHQSEEYNLSVALRQSWLEPLMAWPFYLPLAVLGVPLEMFLVTGTCMTLYQFWIHTQVIGRLGAVEYVFNTPSHHRVHHGVNPQYLDKNFGAVLIIWDRLFGSYAPEAVPPSYGTVHPLTSWSAVRANWDGWQRLIQTSRRLPRAADRLRLWFMPPGWLPASLGGPEPLPAAVAPSVRRYTARARPWVRITLAAQLAALIVLVTVYMTHADAWIGVIHKAVARAARATAVGVLKGGGQFIRNGKLLGQVPVPHPFVAKGPFLDRAGHPGAHDHTDRDATKCPIDGPELAGDDAHGVAKGDGGGSDRIAVERPNGDACNRSNHQSPRAGRQGGCGLFLG